VLKSAVLLRQPVVFFVFLFRVQFTEFYLTVLLLAIATENISMALDSILHSDYVPHGSLDGHEAEKVMELLEPLLFSLSTSN